MRPWHGRSSYSAGNPVAGYNRRDQIGHWVTREQPVYRPCHHACCRGYTATDDQLAAHYTKMIGVENDPQARGAELQILAEFERRDRREQKRRERAALAERRREAIAANRAIRRTENEVERERIRVRAEAATRGYLVNAKGRRLGINPDEVLTGRQAVFERYASDEARDFFRANPRPTAAYFRGRDARVNARAAS